MNNKPEDYKIRDEIILFAHALEHQMRYNEQRGKGDSWKTLPMDYLSKKLKEEYKELRKSLKVNLRTTYRFIPGPADIRHECRDVACMALFIWWRCGGMDEIELEPPAPPEVPQS